VHGSINIRNLNPAFCDTNIFVYDSIFGFIFLVVVS